MTAPTGKPVGRPPMHHKMRRYRVYISVRGDVLEEYLREAKLRGVTLSALVNDMLIKHAIQDGLLRRAAVTQETAL